MGILPTQKVSVLLRGQDAHGTLVMIIVAGHVCLDIIPHFPSRASLDPGTLVRVGAATLSTGGVSNVGVALHRLGTPVRLIHKVGNDLFGGAIRSILTGLSPELASGVRTVPGETTSYSIVVAPPGVDRMFIHCPGANDTFGCDDVPADQLIGATHLHFGYPPVMRGIYSDGGSACAATLARAKSAGLSTSLDFCSIDPHSDAGAVDWEKWLRLVLPHVDFFVPSLDEMACAFRIPIPTGFDDILSLAQRLADMGPRIVMLKIGERGLLVWDRERSIVHCQPCFKVNVVSTNGAGDAAVAGFLSAYVHQKDHLDHAAIFASAVGACACEAADATGGIPPAEKVWDRQARTWAQLPGLNAPSKET